MAIRAPDGANNVRNDGDDNDDEDVGVFLIPYQETAAIRQSC